MALLRHYDRPAVDGLDFAVEAGEFYAPLGPNDVGKTTTSRMVAGLPRSVRGAIAVCGLRRFRPRGARLYSGGDVQRREISTSTVYGVSQVLEWA